MDHNAPEWKEMLKRQDANCPRVGRLVMVDKGRHEGFIGRVTYHGRDPYSDVYNYDDRAFLDAEGRLGWRCRIVDNAGNEIFVPADSVIVALESGGLYDRLRARVGFHHYVITNNWEVRRYRCVLMSGAKPVYFLERK